jgi:murein hydrolase activator
MRKWINVILVLLLALNAGEGFSQNRKELEQRKQKLLKEISETSKQLQETEKSKSLTAAQLDALKKKIRLRQELIGTINREMESLNREINTTSGEIRSLENRMTQLKTEYANMVRFAQRNKSSYQRLMFVFASDDFNQAYKRLRYLQQYSEHRRHQASLIDSTKIQLDSKKQALEVQRNEKNALRETELKQKSMLEQDKVVQDRALARLQDREKVLKKQLADKQRAKQRLDKAIDDLVRKEIEAARKKATAAGKKNVTSANVFTLTPEAQKLSAGFANNRGKLPWPVEKGRITGRFGDHPHPELKGIMIKNNGVDIRSTPGSQARAVFDGEVSGVINIPGAQSAVIVRHGEYLTVYSNLENVFVKKGDKVKTLQNIGKIYTDPDENVSELHLEVWKGTTKLDPAGWLLPR